MKEAKGRPQKKNSLGTYYIKMSFTIAIFHILLKKYLL